MSSQNAIELLQMYRDIRAVIFGVLVVVAVSAGRHVAWVEHSRHAADQAVQVFYGLSEATAPGTLLLGRRRVSCRPRWRLLTLALHVMDWTVVLQNLRVLKLRWL
jgi:hypothetical protein